MIKLLDNKTETIAQKIRALFQVSYKVEAELLGAEENFPPLKRKLLDFIICNNEFYGYCVKNELAAVIEIKSDEYQTHIQSLVVDPKFFRQGIARHLIEFVFSNYKTPMFMVETGVDNGPAKKLYLKHGFKEVKQWNTDIGIRKVRYEKNLNIETIHFSIKAK